VFYELRNFVERRRETDKPFDLVPIRASDRSPREPLVWDRMRDALWGNLARWLKPVDVGGLGGAIPEDAFLEGELHAHAWTIGTNGRSKATPKKDVKKLLGRSPDRADAVALAAWESLPTDDDDEAQRRRARERSERSAELRTPFGAPTIDPYAGQLDPFSSRRNRLQ